MTAELDVRVVPFDDRYADAFRALNLAWIKEFFCVEEEDLRQLEDPSGTLIEPGGEVFFVLEGDEVRGTCGLERHDAGTWELVKMAVDPGARGRGYGDRLIEACIDHARQAGAHRILILSNTVLAPAIRLYRKHGFEPTGRGRHPLYERCNVELELRLAPAS